MKSTAKYLSKPAAAMYKSILSWCNGDPLHTVINLYNDYLTEKNYYKVRVLSEIWDYLKDQEEFTDECAEPNYFIPSDADMGL